MDFHFDQLLTVIFTLFAVIDIVGSIPLLIAMKEKSGAIKSLRVTLISGALMILFLFLGKPFLQILGLDVNAAKLAFGEILGQKTLNSQQIRFMDTLINFFSVKGIVEADMLFNPPFTEINTSGITGVFDMQTATQIISLIERVNMNAEVA